MDPSAASELIERVVAAACSRLGAARFCWEPARDAPDFSRPVFMLPIGEDLCDLLFNGRTGYRAHYYLSPEEGEAFNAVLLAALWPILRTVAGAVPAAADGALLQQCCSRPDAKAWYAGDWATTVGLPPLLQVPRWVEYWRGRQEEPSGLTLPLCDALDVKGAWAQRATGDFRSLKPCRSKAINLTGWA